MQRQAAILTYDYIWVVQVRERQNKFSLPLFLVKQCIFDIIPQWLTTSDPLMSPTDNAIDAISVISVKFTMSFTRMHCLPCFLDKTKHMTFINNSNLNVIIIKQFWTVKEPCKIQMNAIILFCNKVKTNIHSLLFYYSFWLFKL
jgi:hypothetical protein